MRAADIAKLILALAAAILFAWSLRTGADEPRWIAIALLAIAVALRWWRPRPPRG